MLNSQKIIPPKTKWGSSREISFSEFTQIDDEGEKIEFSESWEASDKGEAAQNLYTHLEIEIAILRLPTKEAQALRLSREGYSRKEIADKMRIKPNAVKQLIYRGYRRIKDTAAKKPNF